MSRRQIVAAMAAVLACGCGSGDNSGPSLRVQLTVDEASCGTAPELITFPCQGRVGVWLLDEFDQVRDEFCVGMPEGTPLPGLDNVLEANDVKFEDLEIGDTVTLEIAVFNDNVEVCERPFRGDPIDPPEPPLPQLDTIFLAGRSNPTVLDQSTEILVPLTCGVVDEQCDAGFTAFADVVDLDSLFIQQGPGQIDRLEFGFVADRFFVNLSDMAFDADFLQYSAKLAEPPSPEAQCIGAVATTPFSPLPFLSCDGFADFEFANVLAYTIDPSRLDQFQTSVTDPGDDEGVLVGRVVDQDNQPVAGAHVESEFGALVMYPNTEVDGTANLGSTGKDGYFIMQGPGSECCQQLTVFDVNSNGEEGGVSAPTGTVPGLITVTVISSVPGDIVDPMPDPDQPPPEPAPNLRTF